MTAADTTPEHAKACQDCGRQVWTLQRRSVYAVAVSRRRCATQAGDHVPRASPAARTGAARPPDPKLGYIFVNTKDSPGTSAGCRRIRNTCPATESGIEPYVRSAPQGFGFNAPVKDANGRTIGNLPCFKPPWGRLIAVNANTGDFAWQVPLGSPSRCRRASKTPVCEQRRPHRHGGRPGIHRSDHGQPLPRVRFQDRQGAVGHQARLHRDGGADDVQGKNGKQYVAIVAATGGGFGGGRGAKASPPATQNQGIFVFALP